MSAFLKAFKRVDPTTTTTTTEAMNDDDEEARGGVEPERARLERSLYWWNVGMGSLHFVQAVIALALALSVDRLKNFKLPLTTVFTDWATGYPVQVLVQRGLLPLPAVATLFSFLSAAAHWLVVALFDVYVKDLRRGINRFRWYEYALSSSVMIALIAQLFGCYDIVSLVLIVCINAAMNLFGYLMELVNQYAAAAANANAPSPTTTTTTTTTDWTAFWFGCFAGAVPWACILTYLGAGAGANVPGFVWGILVCYFVCFNSFPITMVMQYAKWGPMAGPLGYYVGERSYQIQSLVAKTLLVWLVIGGANQPNAYAKG
ncbi:integral membrane protein [Zopfochytrium polystomum]|nr:integral membrane protein [Zopfochytrium polystomum]